jgi:hypothetical protein
MADEKRAFEAMMAEVEDSDSDHESSRKAAKKSSPPSSLSSRFEAPKSANSIRNVENGNQGSRLTAAQPKENLRISSSNSSVSKFDQDIMNFGEEQKKGGREGRGSASSNSAMSKNWLMRPCAPNEPPMLCFVEREKPTFGALSGGTIYRMYMEVGNDVRRAKFLMSAKKILSKRTSYYLVSTEMEPNDDRGGDEVLGKVRANAVGSRYLLTDHGLAPDKTQAPSMLRKVSPAALLLF